MLATSSPNQDEFDKQLESYRVGKVLRIGAWIQRFIRNCQSCSDDWEYVPLKTGEVKTKPSGGSNKCSEKQLTTARSKA